MTDTVGSFLGTKRPLSLLQVGFFPSRNSAKSHSMLAACISSCMHVAMLPCSNLQEPLNKMLKDLFVDFRCIALRLACARMRNMEPSTNYRCKHKKEKWDWGQIFIIMLPLMFNHTTMVTNDHTTLLSDTTEHTNPPQPSGWVHAK